MLVPPALKCLFIHQMALLDLGVATGPGLLEEVYSYMMEGEGSETNTELLAHALSDKVKELSVGRSH